MTLVEEFALLMSGQRLMVPHMAERVLTYLALANRPVARVRLAGELWPDCTDHGASKSLRTALWRLRQVDRNLVEISGERLRLDPKVEVDIAQLTELAQELVLAPGTESLRHVQLLIDHAELLPDWDEEWVAANRERYRLARLAALESAAAALLERDQPRPALIAAMAVVQAEPLRESARRIVMRVHLAQGNTVDAIHEHQRYRRLLQAEFGVEPSPEMDSLIAACYQPHVTLR
ncbi:MAG: AfsR/SARP family transcriptional regulator [Candidatus Sericytochromatia bacterium]